MKKLLLSILVLGGLSQLPVKSMDIGFAATLSFAHGCYDVYKNENRNIFNIKERTKELYHAWRSGDTEGLGQSFKAFPQGVLGAPVYAAASFAFAKYALGKAVMPLPVSIGLSLASYAIPSFIQWFWKKYKKPAEPTEQLELNNTRTSSANQQGYVETKDAQAPNSVQQGQGNLSKGNSSTTAPVAEVVTGKSNQPNKPSGSPSSDTQVVTEKPGKKTAEEIYKDSLRQAAQKQPVKRLSSREEIRARIIKGGARQIHHAVVINNG